MSTRESERIAARTQAVQDSSSNSEETPMLADTGATVHVHRSLDAFAPGSLRSCDRGVASATDDGVVRQKGTVAILLVELGATLMLKDVLHIPDGPADTMSMKQFEKIRGKNDGRGLVLDGKKVSFVDKNCRFKVMNMSKYYMDSLGHSENGDSVEMVNAVISDLTCDDGLHAEATLL
ncbi:hypothetical protein BROUX41_000098 [Berkeleyomyces rouxiae]